jgi:hypothetical protein
MLPSLALLSLMQPSLPPFPAQGYFPILSIEIDDDIRLTLFWFVSIALTLFQGYTSTSWPK